MYAQCVSGIWDRLIISISIFCKSKQLVEIGRCVPNFEFDPTTYLLVSVTPMITCSMDCSLCLLCTMGFEFIETIKVKYKCWYDHRLSPCSGPWVRKNPKCKFKMNLLKENQLNASAWRKRWTDIVLWICGSNYIIHGFYNGTETTTVSLLSNYNCIKNCMCYIFVSFVSPFHSHAPLWLFIIIFILMWICVRSLNLCCYFPNKISKKCGPWTKNNN